MIVPVVIAGVVGVFAARGFIAGIRHEPGEAASLAEWFLGVGIGALAGVMIFSLLK